MADEKLGIIWSQLLDAKKTLSPVRSILKAILFRAPPEGRLDLVTNMQYAIQSASVESPGPDILSCYCLKLELELELIQTQMTQKPMLRAEVGMRVRCANKASAECIMRGRGIGQNPRKSLPAC